MTYYNLHNRYGLENNILDVRPDLIGDQIKKINAILNDLNIKTRINQISEGNKTKTYKMWDEILSVINLKKDLETI